MYCTVPVLPVLLKSTRSFVSRYVGDAVASCFLIHPAQPPGPQLRCPGSNLHLEGLGNDAFSAPADKAGLRGFCSRSPISNPYYTISMLKSQAIVPISGTFSC